MFWRWKQSSSGTVGVFGKHAMTSDFVRLNASSPTVTSFDQWLSRALVATAQICPDWSQVLRRIEHLTVLHHGPQDVCVTGLMASSHDRSGRQFPLSVFAHLPSSALQQDYPALPHDGFMAQAARLLRVRESLSKEDLFRAAQNIVGPSRQSLKEARSRRDAFLRETTVATAFPGETLSTEQLGRALGALREAVKRVNASSALPRLAIRCALGTHPEGTVGLWLGLLQQQLTVPLVPHLLWSKDALLISFSPPGPRAFAAVLLPEWQDDSIWDLRMSGGSDVALPPPDSPLLSLLRR